MTAQQVRDAANAFYDHLSGDFWEEHGISREEALDGMIAAFQAIGTLTPQQVGGIRFGIKRLEIKAERERQRKEGARRAAMTPEEREREDKSRANLVSTMQAQSRIMRDVVIDRTYSSSPSFSFLKSKP